MEKIYQNMLGEYQHAIKVQNSIIEKNNQRLKKARNENNFKEIKRLCSLLTVLYEERSELVERANGLRKYT